MRIALDYDGTYTADPYMFDKLISISSYFGHTITFVTMRYASEPLNISFDSIKVIYTGRKAKKPYCQSIGREFDIWIDDQPELILMDAK